MIRFLAVAFLVLVAALPAAGAAAGVARAPAATGFVLPLAASPVVVGVFAPPQVRYLAGHRGVDLAAPPGATILAAGPGRVVYADELAGRGVLSIEHEGGLRTTYEPVTASVTAGQPVVAGQPIGTLQAGHAPCAPASCLHWGARLPGEVYIDPMALLRPWAVRLWPWAGR